MARWALMASAACAISLFAICWVSSLAGINEPDDPWNWVARQSGLTYTPRQPAVSLDVMIDTNPLSGIPLFAGLGRDEQAYLAGSMTRREVPALQTLFWVGDPGREMYIIVKGRIQICIPDADGKDICLAVLGAGEFF